MGCTHSVKVTAGQRGTAGEPEATEFAAWVRPHLPAMTRLAARMAPSADQDDIVQDALVRAWRRRSTFDPGRGSPAGWLLAIVTDQARRHRKRSLHSPLVTIDGRRLASELVEHGLDLEWALAKLPARQRLAIDLYYFAGTDVATTAEVMGCAPGTVKATLHQARERLRVLLGAER
jgi:RNA polymerase sigma-70 factor, ECF subfamily